MSQVMSEATVSRPLEPGTTTRTVYRLRIQRDGSGGWTSFGSEHQDHAAAHGRLAMARARHPEHRFRLEARTITFGPWQVRR